MARLIESVVGHENVFRFLMESLNKQQVPPSLIFTGPSGVGKQKMAMAWAQVLLCERSDSAPCGECSSCIQMSEGYHAHLHFIEPEKSTIKIEQTKAMMKSISLRREEGGRAVVIFNEAQNLNPQAANSILKLVEEPPEGVHFIFVTSSYHALLPTLRSRSQRVQFCSLSQNQLQQITGESGWVLASAQGRVDQLMNLVGEESSDLRSQALRVMPGLFDESRPMHVVEGVKDSLKDREKLKFISTVWKQLIRDSFFSSASERIHSDCSIDFLDAVEVPMRLTAFEKLTAFDRAIEGNADSQLALESFVLDMKEAQHA